MTNAGSRPACGSSCCGQSSQVEATGSVLNENSCKSIADSLPDCCPDGGRCDEGCIKAIAKLECQVAHDDKAQRPEASCCSVGEDEVNEVKRCQSVCCNSVTDDGNTNTTPELAHGCNSREDRDRDNSPHDEHLHRENETAATEPCNSHLRSAFERYTAYLETARCICTSVLSQGLDGCCGKPVMEPRSSPMGTTAGASTAISVPSKTSCISQRSSRRCGSRRQDGEYQNRPLVVATKGCCAKETASDSVKDSVSPVSSTAAKHIPIDEDAIDVEKAGSAEHVLLQVSGMTCTGCANTIQRALSAIDGTSNVRATFVTSTADFDLDTAVTTVHEAIASVHKATHFQFVRYDSDTQSLTVLLDAQAAIDFGVKLLRGVDTCEAVGKGGFRVTYDPCIVGARDVLAATGGDLAPPEYYDRNSTDRRKLWRKAARTLVALLFTIPVLVLAWSDVEVHEHTKLVISLVLATIVQSLAYPEYYRPGILALIRERIMEMDMLIVISITAAYAYSVIACGLTLAGRDLELDAFFETSTLLITLVMLSRLVAVYARQRAVETVSMRSMQTATAVLATAEGATKSIDARLLHLGDTILIAPHSRIVTDVEVLSGTSEVDESMLTGESLPVLKTPSSSAVAGTINGAGSLTARVTRLLGRNTITDIAELVERAQSSKPKIQELADKVAGYFIPVVCSITVIVTVIWVIVALKVRGQDVGRAVGTAISYGIAVLAISCPCALGMAVPMVLVVAGGVAAKAGVVIKSAEIFERAFRVTDVVFDKTGTLTSSDLQVVHQQVTPSDVVPTNRILELSSLLVQDSQHPVAKAVASALRDKSTQHLEVRDVTSIPGCGIQASYQGRVVRVGNPSWLQVEAHPDLDRCTQQGMSIMCMTVGTELAAVFGLTSTLRPEAAAVVRELQNRQIRVHVVSGDATKPVSEVASALNIPLEHAVSRCSPAGKQTFLRNLMNEAKVVLFCGDGTNDAVAVAQADIGVQIGSSSDVARATADVVLLNDLKGVLHLLDTSKAAYRRIILLLAWSFFYNVFAILLASGAFVRVRIKPAYVGLGEMVSIVPVIAVALSMLRMRKG